MEIQTKFFNILSENEVNYFAQLEGVLSAVDEFSSLSIVRTPYNYNFRLAPSMPKYTNIIIEQLIQFHNSLGIRLNFSKSIKTTASINFTISLEVPD